MATPLFVVTDAGLAAASVATPVGPFIKIVSFAVGSAYGYEVLPNQTALNGELLYEGVISSYAYVGDNTINVVCKIPADAGPFEFGEVALYLEDGDGNLVMFAKAAFDTPQIKSTSLGTNLALVYTFNCLMKLAQSVAVFQIITGSGESQPFLYVDLWSDVVPPDLAADPDLPLLIVRELDSKGQASLLVNTGDTKWTIASAYYDLDKYTITNSSLSWIQIAAASWTEDIDLVENSLVIETADGWFRQVSSIALVGSTGIRFNLAGEPLPVLPVVGQQFILHVNRSGESLPVLAASMALVSDSAGQITTSANVSAVEVGYLDGASSNIQNQLNGKQATITGAATTITAANLTANRVVISNASGKIAISGITTTELNALAGVDSNIQAQIDALEDDAWPGVTTSSSGSNTNFTVGTFLWADSDPGAGGGTTQGSVFKIRLVSGWFYGYTGSTPPSGVAVPGTWRLRGKGPDVDGEANGVLLQRTS